MPYPYCWLGLSYTCSPYLRLTEVACSSCRPHTRPVDWSWHSRYMQSSVAHKKLPLPVELVGWPCRLALSHAPTVNAGIKPTPLAKDTSSSMQAAPPPPGGCIAHRLCKECCKARLQQACEIHIHIQGSCLPQVYQLADLPEMLLHQCFREVDVHRGLQNVNILELYAAFVVSHKRHAALASHSFATIPARLNILLLLIRNGVVVTRIHCSRNFISVSVVDPVGYATSASTSTR